MWPLSVSLLLDSSFKRKRERERERRRERERGDRERWRRERKREEKKRERERERESSKTIRKYLKCTMIKLRMAVKHVARFIKHLLNITLLDHDNI